MLRKLNAPDRLHFLMFTLEQLQSIKAQNENSMLFHSAIGNSSIVEYCRECDLIIRDVILDKEISRKIIDDNAMEKLAAYDYLIDIAGDMIDGKEANPVQLNLCNRNFKLFLE